MPLAMEVQTSLMFSRICVVLFIFVFPLLCEKSSLIDMKPLLDPTLENYRYCLADMRGGIYWSSLKQVSCLYESNPTDNSLQDIKCEWKSSAYVSVTFEVALSPENKTKNSTIKCSNVRQVTSHTLGEFSKIDLDSHIGLHRLFAAPAAYMYWRNWLGRSSPLRIVLSGITSAMPSLRNFTSLKSFALSESAGQFTKGAYNGTTRYALPSLPSSLEDLLLENNDLKNFPHPNNNTFPALRRMSLSKNRLTNTHLENNELFKQLAPNLEELDFSFNGIVHVMQTDFDSFPKLRLINFSHNRLIFSFHYPLFPSTIKSLNVSYNTYITDLPSTKVGVIYPNLENLDISFTLPRNNETILFPVAAPKLERLIISGFENYQIANLNLDYLKMNVQNGVLPMIINSSITTLDFSHGNIRKLRNLGSNNTKVDYLDLSNNLVSVWTNDSLFTVNVSTTWTQSVNLSYNHIRILLPSMLLSIQRLKAVDLGANPFECNNCSIYIFQAWLPFHRHLILNLNQVTKPLLCGSPISMRKIPVTDTSYYDAYCADSTSKLGAIPAVIIAGFLIVQVILMYRYRLQIIFMFHMYRLRVRGVQDHVAGCTHDVFICYSSVDRPFVMETLAPFIEEEAPEYYKAYIHERSFTLGSNISTNIVEAIEKSRHALLVISQAFLKSEFCKKEYDMVTHRAFDGNPGYMVMLRYGALRKEELPRTLRMYMTTTTYLEWPEYPSEIERLEVRKRLVTALGRSLHQRSTDTQHEQTSLELAVKDDLSEIPDTKRNDKIT